MQEDNEFRFQELEKRGDAGAAGQQRSTEIATAAGRRQAAGGRQRPPATDSRTVGRRRRSDRRQPDRRRRHGPALGAPPAGPSARSPSTTTATSPAAASANHDRRACRRRGPDPSDGTDRLRRCRRPTIPDELYRNSYEFILSGDYGTAEAGFRDHISRFPADPEGRRRAFLAGRGAARPEEISRRGRDLPRGQQANTRSSKKAPDMLLKLGVSLTGLDQRDVACATYTEIGKRYPDIVRCAEGARQAGTGPGRVLSRPRRHRSPAAVSQTIRPCLAHARSSPPFPAAATPPALLLLLKDYLDRSAPETRLVAVTSTMACAPSRPREARGCRAALRARIGIAHRTLAWTGQSRRPALPPPRARRATGCSPRPRRARRHRPGADRPHARRPGRDRADAAGARGDGRGLAGMAPATLYRRAESGSLRPLLGSRREALARLPGRAGRRLDRRSDQREPGLRAAAGPRDWRRGRWRRADRRRADGAPQLRRIGAKSLAKPPPI